jgi:hypothetical protein
VPDALAEALGFNPRTRDRAQFLNLLDVWDSKLHGFLLAGEYEHFSKLEKEVREGMLQSWADSSLRKRRAAFQGLRKAIGFLYVMLPGNGGGASRVWQKIKFPGPLGVQRPLAARMLQVVVPEKETKLTCEVCVIGSGAGGGVAAAELAAAGKDVLVMEAGNYYDDADFDGAELAGFQRLYLEGGFAGTQDHSVGFLAGECLGGGTVVNYSTSFRTPDDIREEWAEAGAKWIATAEYAKSLDAVCERLHVNREENRVSAREQVLERRRWAVLAPALVRPLPFLVGTYGKGKRSPGGVGVLRQVVPHWLEHEGNVLIERYERVLDASGDDGAVRVWLKRAVEP